MQVIIQVPVLVGVEVVGGYFIELSYLARVASHLLLAPEEGPQERVVDQVEALFVQVYFFKEDLALDVVVVNALSVRIPARVSEGLRKAARQA